MAENTDPGKIYVVEARRWGIRENHSYVVSCYYSLYLAIESAKLEHQEQGNKYKVVVNECDLNKHDPATVKEVFTTQIN